MAFDGRRQLMFSLLSDIEGFRCIEPEGAFYAFPNVTEAMGDDYASSVDLATAIIERANVALVPGESFGAPGHLRLSSALGEDDIRKGVDRIAELLQGGLDAS